ncbi:MAG: ornithine cyclodeaminase family protein [Rhodospirillales bacterium]|nr:ornithine cyclodeaminase family protein [Rhodospirillales bacterium]
MINIDAQQVIKTLDYPSLIDQLGKAFNDNFTVPLRHHHTIGGNGADGTLLLMPAWKQGEVIGIKIASVFPDNNQQNLPAVMASYLLLNGKTGEPLAMIEGRELTARRTAAASALASRYLSRPDSNHLLMVGTGKLAPELIRAHSSVRPLKKVTIWGRSLEKADALSKSLRNEGFQVRTTDDLEGAVAQAHIISCATLSENPLVKGAWLQPGQHLDLVGGFRPQMRETDDDAIKRCRLFVDTREGACKESGDIADPLNRGIITHDDINAGLFDLCRGTHEGRDTVQEITLFKSVGTALEDLAAAQLVFDRN